MAALCKTQELQLSGVVHSVAFCTETHHEDTSSVESPNTSSVETSDSSSIETPETPLVEAQEVLLLSGCVHSMAYCKETGDLLLCDNHTFTIEQFSHSSSSGLSLQPQKLWKLGEMHSISCPTSVQIARRMGCIFIGCDSNEGIYVLDRDSFQLVKRFAQKMNRDFDYMVVDETEYPQRSTAVYASSINKGKLTKFDYNTGSMMSELSVTVPNNIVLKDDKLYTICEFDSTDCILVIDKHSLKMQSKFALSDWSLLGGLCLDERSNVCVTAWTESNHRILYSFDDGGKEVGNVQLPEFDDDAYVLDMIAVDNDLFMLTQEYEEFFLKRLPFKF